MAISIDNIVVIAVILLVTVFLVKSVKGIVKFAVIVGALAAIVIYVIPTFIL